MTRRILALTCAIIFALLMPLQAIGEDLSLGTKAALKALHVEHVNHGRTDVFLPGSAALLDYAAQLQADGHSRAARLAVSTLFEDTGIDMDAEARAELSAAAFVVLAETYFADGDFVRSFLASNLAVSFNVVNSIAWSTRHADLQRLMDARAAETPDATATRAQWQAEANALYTTLVERSGTRQDLFSAFVAAIGADNPDTLNAAAETFLAFAEPDDALAALVRLITARQLLFATDANGNRRIGDARIWLQRVLDLPTAYLAALPAHDAIGQPVLELLTLAAATFRQDAFSDADLAVGLAGKAADMARSIGTDHNVHFLKALEAEALALQFAARRADAIEAWRKIDAYLSGIRAGRRLNDDERETETTARLGLAQLLTEEPGREVEAESAFLDALASAERLGSGQIARYGEALFSFGDFLAAQLRSDEALGVYRTAVQVLERAPDVEQQVLVYALNRLALAEIAIARDEDAWRTLNRARTLARSGVDPSDPVHVAILQSLSDLALGRNSGSSDALVAELEAARAAAVSGNSPQLLRYRAFAAILNQSFERFGMGDLDGAAEAAYAAIEKARSDNMPEWEKDARQVAAAVELGRDNLVAALQQSRELDGLQQQGAATEVLHERQSILFNHLQAAIALLGDAEADQATILREEAFQVAQRLARARVGSDVEQANLRRTLSDRDVGSSLRRLQDLERQRDGVATELAFALANSKPIESIRAGLDAVEQRIVETRSNITEIFPAYAEQLGAETASLSDVAARLQPNEAIVQYVTHRSGDVHLGYALTITNTTFGVGRLYFKGDLNDLARRLRCAAARTDPRCSAGPIVGGEQRGAFGAGSFSDTTNETEAAVFDYKAAHLAYQTLIDVLPLGLADEDIDHLIIIPGASLVSMPFHLIVTAATPQEVAPKDAPWLLREVAITVAPSATSFAGLRRAAAQNQEAGADKRQRFLGVGDPLIGIQAGGEIPFSCSGVASPANATTTDLQVAASASANFLRGAAINTDTLRQLAALPDTECELRATADVFDDGASRLLLHADANETALKTMNASGALRDFDVISVATHGLIAGEISATSAGLVLTPPDAPTNTDDGLLTTAEIAALDLDADFVILSACNTASGNEADEEGLTGLAGAFFFAGARNLLVSHWPVYSDAATRLTTGMFRELTTNPAITRAEALRRSMLSVLDDPGASQRERHPSYWAPFMMVGEGGSGS